MHRWCWTGSLLLLFACRADPLGKPCDVDDDCGPGFDCFPDVCVQVCTKDDECREGETCYRYHCIVPGQQHSRTRRKPLPAKPAVATPPVPDVTAAELRAIRRELELLRREQARLADLIEKMQGTKKPAKAGPVVIQKK